MENENMNNNINNEVNAPVTNIVPEQPVLNNNVVKEKNEESNNNRKKILTAFLMLIVTAISLTTAFIIGFVSNSSTIFSFSSFSSTKLSSSPIFLISVI